MTQSPINMLRKFPSMYSCSSTSKTALRAPPVLLPLFRTVLLLMLAVMACSAHASARVEVAAPGLYAVAQAPAPAAAVEAYLSEPASEAERQDAEAQQLLALLQGGNNTDDECGDLHWHQLPVVSPAPAAAAHITPHPVLNLALRPTLLLRPPTAQ